VLKLKEAMSEGWWDDLSKDAQAAYKKAHPGSQQAKNSKDTDDSQRDSIKTGIKKAIAKDKKGQDKRKKLNRKWDDAQKQKGMDKASDLAKKGMEKGRVPDEDDYDMGEVPGSREEWEDIEPGDPEMRSGDESAEELGDLMKQQQNHIEDMFEKGADREDIEAAEGNLEDLEREYDEKVESGEGEDDEDDWGKKESLTIDGKQYNRISEGKINSKFIKYRIYDKIADEINKVEPDNFNLRKFNSVKRKLIQFVEREVKRDKKMASMSVLKQAWKRSDFDDKVFGRSGIIDDWYKKSERDFPKFLKRNPNLKWKNYNASSLTYGISKPLYKVLDSLLNGINNLVPESKYEFSEFYERFKR